MDTYDSPEARAYLEEMLRLLDKRVTILQSPGDWEGTRTIKDLERAIDARLGNTMRIVSRVEPEASRLSRNPRTRYTELRQAVDKAITALDEADRMAAILTPPGPSVRAAELHPWVWDEAKRHWDVGHYRSAVQAAATNVDTKTQGKLERWDISGTDLARQAWSFSDPEPDKSRLRPPGYDRVSEASRSELNGCRALHDAVMAGLRNRATHDLTEIEEHIALEQLATISLLARWIDAAVVVRAN